MKIQVVFNPARVKTYRLIGYEDRMLAARDFEDDRKDAGEIGAGHTVTALYEVVPVAGSEGASRRQRKSVGGGEELLSVKLRYKSPQAEQCQLLSVPLRDQPRSLEDSGADFRFAASVAWFAMVLRGSPHAGQNPAPLDTIWALARASQGQDPSGYRAEFLQLVDLARRME